MMLRHVLAAGQVVQSQLSIPACSCLASALGSSTSLTAPGSKRSYHVAHLASRGVISITGNEAVQFMQGMTTNDLRPLEQPGTGPIYTVLLTAKGKYLHDLFAYSLPGDTQRLLLDVDASGVSSALQWLSRYKLRRKLVLEDVSSSVAVWAAFDGQLKPAAGDQWRQDPRLPELGLRGLFDAQQLPHPPAEAGGTSSRKQRAAGLSVVGEDAHRRWRYQLGVAEGDREIPSGEVAPLECNLDALAGISYSKGCYIGQERNSYTHYRGIIRRRMMPVLLPRVEASTRLPCPIPIVSAAAAQSSQSAATPAAATRSRGAIGILTAHVGDVGMAYIKLGPALAAAQGSGPLLQLQLQEADPQQQQQVPVVPQRPQWWPEEWGREEEQRSTNAP